jgi:uncharacterized membrane protein
VDEDYRGNLGVVLFNHSDKPFIVSRGDRIAQLICQQIYYPELQEVEVSIMQFYIFSRTSVQIVSQCLSHVVSEMARQD